MEGLGSGLLRHELRVACDVHSPTLLGGGREVTTVEPTKGKQPVTQTPSLTLTRE
jgi:hypothetical protein